MSPADHESHYFLLLVYVTYDCLYASAHHMEIIHKATPLTLPDISFVSADNG